MTKNDIINTSLIALGSGLITFAIANLATNGWFSLVCAVLGLATYYLFTVFPD